MSIILESKDSQHDIVFVKEVLKESQNNDQDSSIGSERGLRESNKSE